MIMNKTIKMWLIKWVIASLGTTLYAQIRPHHIFDNNMVLQRDKAVKVWGWADKGEKVTVKFGGQEKSVVVNDKEEWEVFLEPMGVNNAPQEMIITGGQGKAVIFKNVLLGEVWLLGGQSNMEFDLARIYHGDTEIASANFSNIRLMTIPRAAGPEPLNDFERINEYDRWLDRYDEKGYWFNCSPETVKTFSGLGYIFGRRIHMASQVPIGLIDVSRGGTCLETWLSSNTLAGMPGNKDLLKQWKDKADAYNPEEDLKKQIANWEKRTESRKKQGLEPGPKPTEPSTHPLFDFNCPGSCYNGNIAPIAGLAVKGAIFHHGYNNALSDSRPHQYAENFSALIRDWREAFNDDNMPFGIIALSAGGSAQTRENFEEFMVDAGPFIREGQFLAYEKNNDVGYACAYDQQVSWYHPQKKVELGERMARWALATQYNLELVWKPVVYANMEEQGDKIIVTLTKEVKASDDRPVEGLAIAGSDRHFMPAKAEFVVIGKNERGQAQYDKKKLVVSNSLISDPVAVRYAWARNPLGNLVNQECPIIPVVPFRTDNWDYPEAPYDADEYAKHRVMLSEMRKQAIVQAKERIIKEAEEVLKENNK